MTRCPEPRRRRLSLALLAAALACGGDAPAVSRGAPSLPEWAVGEEPALVLADDGSEEKLFSRVEARRLPDGGIAVADAGTTTIHLFGRDGRLRRTLARRGGGPGELQGEVRLVAVGDTLLAFGRSPMSPPDVHLYTAEGFARRTRPQTDSVRTFTAHDGLATGQLVVTRGGDFKVLHAPPVAGTVTPDTVVYGLYSEDAGGGRGVVVWLPPVERWQLYAFPWRTSRIGAGQSRFELGPATMMAASGDRVWLVDGGTGALRAYDGAGRAIVTAALPLEARPFDEAPLARRRASALAAATRELDSAKVRAMYDPAIRPSTMPVLSGAHAGADGELWVRRFDLDDAAPQRFLIVSRDGAPIARATLPAGLEVHQVGRDFVLGVLHDEAGVPTVVEYEVRR